MSRVICGRRSGSKEPETHRLRLRCCSAAPHPNHRNVVTPAYFGRIDHLFRGATCEILACQRVKKTMRVAGEYQRSRNPSLYNTAILPCSCRCRSIEQRSIVVPADIDDDVISESRISFITLGASRAQKRSRSIIRSCRFVRSWQYSMPCFRGELPMPMSVRPVPCGCARSCRPACADAFADERVVRKPILRGRRRIGGRSEIDHHWSTRRADRVRGRSACDDAFVSVTERRLDLLPRRFAFPRVSVRPFSYGMKYLLHAVVVRTPKRMSPLSLGWVGMTAMRSTALPTHSNPKV